MQRRLLFISIAFAYTSEVLCQTAPQQKPTSVSVSNDKDRFVTQINLTDVHGQPFKNEYSDVTGSPFFVDKWLTASLKLKSGARCDNIQSRLNLCKQELHLRANNDEEWTFSSGYISEVEFLDSLENQKYKFRTGLPAIDNQNENNFYQVFCEGHFSLIKAIRKIISVNKNEISGEIEKKFDTYEDYYLFFNNQIVRLKKDKEFILKMLSERKDQVENFLKNHAINFKNISDVIKLL